MANEKKVFSATDAAPSVLYAKRTASSEQSYPILISSDGAFYTIDDHGMVLPRHDTQVIDENGSNATITYSYTGSTVGVKTIVVSGTRTTISMTYV
jgi:hypothetical protein